MGRPAKPGERAKNKKRVSELYLYGGVSQAEIGAMLKISQKSVSRYIESLQEEWLDASLYDFNKAKLIQLQKIDFLEREAYNAWKKSIGLKKEVTTKTGKKETGPYENESTKKWREVGDPRFLERIAWCIAERSKILGFYAPEKHSGIIGAPATYADWVKMHEEQKKK